MPCGLYGKLPSKRDFIAVGTSRELLKVWEPWMQSGISASRQALGERWQQAFLTAPIWRFWLGAELCGAAVTGAFMPSLDGVGRYFPVTLHARADDGALPPPELAPQEAWFTAVEAFLLSTLDRDATFEATVAALDRLPAPSDAIARPAGADMVSVAGCTIASIAERPLPDVLASIRVADHSTAYAGSTFWWTAGGEGYEPVAISARGMPDAYLFADMLTGRFAFGFE